MIPNPPIKLTAWRSSVAPCPVFQSLVAGDSTLPTARLTTKSTTRLACNSAKRSSSRSSSGATESDRYSIANVSASLGMRCGPEPSCMPFGGKYLALALLQHRKRIEMACGGQPE